MQRHERDGTGASLVYLAALGRFAATLDRSLAGMTISASQRRAPVALALAERAVGYGSGVASRR